MRLPSLISIMLLVAFSSAADARGTQKDLYETGKTGSRSVLPPGAKLLAGNSDKNEFFILAPPEQARPVSTNAATDTEQSKHVMASNITEQVKQGIEKKRDLLGKKSKSVAKKASKAKAKKDIAMKKSVKKLSSKKKLTKRAIAHKDQHKTVHKLKKVHIAMNEAYPETMIG